MNRQMLRVGLAVAAAGAVAATTVVTAQGESGHRHGSNVKTYLSGYSETLVAISSPGRGFFRATIDEDDQEIRYQLSYSGLPTAVSQAHIHFGSAAQSGGVSVFLCANPPVAPPVPTETCPASGTVTGTLTPADVIGPAAQGIAAGEFEELVAAIEAGTGYVNVHTAERPGGEIRGQLR